VGADNVYEVTLQVADDAGAIDTQTISVTVLDVNEAPTTAVNTGITVAENSVDMVISGTSLETTDPESGTTQLTYALTQATLHGTLTKSGVAMTVGSIFTQANIDAGAIKYSNNSDESATDSFKFTVSDGVNTLAEQTFSITVIPVNDNAVVGPIDSNGSANSVAEDAAIDIDVGITASAIDADFGTSITYSLSDSAGGKFAINHTSGVVTVNGVLDFETATSHNITVVATSSDTSTNSQTFTIAVTNVNDNDVIGPVDSNGAVNTVAEDASFGAPVGITAFATDADSGTMISYSLSDDAGGKFAIDEATGVVTVNNALDFETASSHNITVLATSTDGATGSETFTIAVTNVNEAPNITTTALNVEENLTVVGQVGATDPDAGDSRTYSLDGGADAALFSINASTGVLSFINAPDFESPTDAGGNNVYNVNVKVTDGGSLSDTQAVVVTVTNDNTEAPATVTNNGVTVTENSVDTVVTNGLLNTTDQDTGVSLIVYTLTAAPAHGTLTKSGVVLGAGNTFTQANINAGFIKYSQNGDEDPTDSFSFTVGDGTPGNTSSVQTFLITVTNVNDPGSVTISGTTEQGQTLTANVSDPEGTGTINYQWKASGIGIVGATAQTLVLSQGEVGKNITVSVSYTDGKDTSEALTSAATTVVTNTVITGTSAADTLMGGASNEVIYGMDGNDSVLGGAGEDTLDGGTGTDTMKGGIGNDTYVVDNTSDVVTELAGEGTDTVLSSVHRTLGNHQENLVLTGIGAINGNGNSLDNHLTGNSARNVLDGKTGADTMAGGQGDDVYWVDDAGDFVIELAGEGTDHVKTTLDGYILADHVEYLTLTGVALAGAGNAVANLIIGTSGNNTLDGGAGIDTLYGGSGDDTYLVDNYLDVVNEYTSEGTDTVVSGVTYKIGANVENLTLTGGGAINARGNTLDNVLIGNSANNVMEGKSGADTMIGGDGNDYYYVDDPDDQVIEFNGEGTDTVNVYINGYFLPDHVESGLLSGAGNYSLEGNTLANVLTGNAGHNLLGGGDGADTLRGGTGDDTLQGGLGSDNLTGGDGADQFVFGTAPNALTNVDRIVDFVSGTDLLVFDSTVFIGFGTTGAIDSDVFASGAGIATAQDAEDRLIYNTSTGNLFYDEDGAGGVAAVKVAVLTGAPSLTHSDFYIW
jgi:Ca2+-binding RTX toxin-like protein